MIEDREKMTRYAQDVADALSREGMKVALAEWEQDCIDRWKSGETVEDREVASADYRAAERLKQKFEAFVDRGRTAVSDTERAERRKIER